MSLSGKVSFASEEPASEAPELDLDFFFEEPTKPSVRLLGLLRCGRGPVGPWRRRLADMALRFLDPAVGAQAVEPDALAATRVLPQADEDLLELVDCLLGCSAQKIYLDGLPLEIETQAVDLALRFLQVGLEAGDPRIRGLFGHGSASGVSGVDGAPVGGGTPPAGALDAGDGRSVADERHA